MPINSADLSDMSFRLEKLEKQNRVFKRTALLLVFVAGGVVLLGADAKQPKKIIEADGFIMRDAKGVARVEIGHEGFFLNNDDGKHRISIFSSKAGGTGVVLFADDTYKKQVGMAIQDSLDGWCGVNVNDGNGVTRAQLTTVKNKPRFELQDEQGKPFFTQVQP